MDADLDRAFGIQDAVEHRLPEGAAMMKLRSFESARRVAMRIDMNHPDGTILAERLENRIGNGMVAAHRKRYHAGCADRREESLDIGKALLETEPALHRHVADVGGVEMQRWRDVQRVLVRTDALDRSHRARSE